MTAKEVERALELAKDYKAITGQAIDDSIIEALTELEAIKSADSVEAMEVLQQLTKKGVENSKSGSLNVQQEWTIINNYILKAQAQERELRELKANQAKIKTIEGYGIDDVLMIIQGLQSKEITPEILHNNLLMYKKGYEEALEQINKGWKDFNSRLMKMDKVGEEDE